MRAIKQQVALNEARAYQVNGVKLIHLPLNDCPSYDENGDDYYRCYIQEFATTEVYLVGTSKMDPDSNADAEVDHHLRVKGISKLRQIDAGIMPIIPSANVNTSTIMVAERGADFIKIGLGAKKEIGTQSHTGQTLFIYK